MVDHITGYYIDVGASFQMTKVDQEKWRRITWAEWLEWELM